MTKVDSENLSKEVRSVSDKLIRIETLLEGVAVQLKEGAGKFTDHEARIRLIEIGQYKLWGKIGALSFAAGLVAGVVAKIL